MASEQPTRREFFRTCGRWAGSAALLGVAGGLVLRADADRVWQIDPNTCATCRDFLNADGLAKCATDCVLPLSAVRAVNDFSRCGYCYICPAYFDINSEPDPYGVPTATLCPTDAIIRRPVGEQDPWDPANNYYEYTIDEAKCNGCGKCVEACRAPMGNGSLRLEVRHDLCTDCNRCSIAQVCPYDAFRREAVTGEKPGYVGPPGSHQG